MTARPVLVSSATISPERGPVRRAPGDIPRQRMVVEPHLVEYGDIIDGAKGATPIDSILRDDRGTWFYGGASRHVAERPWWARVTVWRAL